MEGIEEHEAVLWDVREGGSSPNEEFVELDRERTSCFETLELRSTPLDLFSSPEIIQCRL